MIREGEAPAEPGVAKTLVFLYAPARQEPVTRPIVLPRNGDT